MSRSTWGGSPSLSGGLGVRWRVSHWTDYLREAAEHLLFGSLCLLVMAGVEADEEINPVAMEVGKVEEEMDEELDTDMVVFRVGELGGQCGNWSDDVGSCGDHPHQQLQ